MADRPANVRIGGDTSRLVAALSKSREILRSWSANVGGEIKSVLSGAFNQLGSMAGFDGVATTLLNAKDAALQTNLALARLVAAADVAQGKRAQVMAQVSADVRAVSAATGASEAELMQGLNAYVEKTGDLEGGLQTIQLMGDAWLASGTSASEMAKVLASLNQQFGLTGNQAVTAINQLAQTGKAGSISFGNLASELPAVAAEFKKFSGADVNQLGAMFQVLGQGGEANVSATRFRNLLMGIQANEKKLNATGINIRDPSGKLKPLTEILDLISKRTDGNTAKVQKLLGSMEAVTAFEALQSTGGKGLVSSFEEAGKAAMNVIAADAQSVAESAAGRQLKAQARLKASIQDVFTPERLDKLASAIETFAEVLKAVIDTASDNPALAIGAAAAWKFGPGLARFASGAIGGKGNQSVFDLLLGKGKAGGAGGGLLGGDWSFTNPLPVTVVGGAPGVGGPGGPGGPAAGGNGRALLGGLLKVGGGAIAGVGGVMAVHEGANPVVGYGGGIVGGLLAGGPLGGAVAGGVALGDILQDKTGYGKWYMRQGGSSQATRSEWQRYGQYAPGQAEERVARERPWDFQGQMAARFGSGDWYERMKIDVRDQMAGEARGRAAAQSLLQKLEVIVRPAPGLAVDVANDPNIRRGG